ncbi:MAG: nicotinate-nucleotide adenylyltransferase [Lachnospiraceae bacterium]|nr:nicotinate-nucleotide adenylyltransferase [Lachnospiraceae bacterium]
MGKKTGILGGTFNPIHTGHLILGEQAMDELKLDKVIFMPSGYSYMKAQSDILPGEHRLRMTELAVADNPRFEVSDMEIKREGATHTADTLRELKEHDPEIQIYYIVGADTLFMMEKWIEPEVIFSNCVVLAAIRDDVDQSELKQKAEQLTERFNARIEVLATSCIDISSRMIRRRISRKQSVRYYLPESVRKYIEENELYI